MSSQDSIFFKNFSILLGAMVVLTIILILFGSYLQTTFVDDVNDPVDRSDIQASIKPVAEVNTNPNAEAEKVTETAETPAIAAAFDGSTDGKLIYDSVCLACHISGAAGAPKLETAAWENRIPKGVDVLVANAINGIMGENNAFMPPRGGRGDLSDEQVKAAVDFMLENIK